MQPVNFAWPDSVFFPLFCRRWGFMIPWLIVYGLNIIGYFAASIVIFYLGVGSTKACGVVPLIYACTLVVGHFSVVYFVLEQVGSLASFVKLGKCGVCRGNFKAPSQSLLTVLDWDARAI